MSDSDVGGTQKPKIPGASGAMAGTMAGTIPGLPWSRVQTLSYCTL